jgi:molecular chaperone DnaJ
MSTKEWLEKDYYKALGVAKDASADEIKKAFRKLARKYHPDKTGGDPKAEQRFKEISEAHSVVGDPKLRAEYDEARSLFGSGYRFTAGSGRQGPSMDDMFGNGNGSISDLLGGLGGLGGLFGQGQQVRFPRPGADVRASATVDLVGALTGATLSVPGVRGKVQVRVPAGVKDGQSVRVRGKGQPGSDGGADGDLLVRVQVKAHPVFGREGKSLTVTAPVTFAEAALGAQIEVPTLDGSKVKLKLPAGTPNGRTFRAKGKGVAGGDLLVSVVVEVPEALDEQARAALETFAEVAAEGNPRAALFADVGA